MALVADSNGLEDNLVAVALGALDIREEHLEGDSHHNIGQASGVWVVASCRLEDTSSVASPWGASWAFQVEVASAREALGAHQLGLHPWVS